MRRRKRIKQNAMLRQFQRAAAELTGRVHEDVQVSPLITQERVDAVTDAEERPRARSRTMTPGERAVWIAVYAASWHAQPSTPAVNDIEHTKWCARQARRALDALHAVAAEDDGGLTCAEAKEVLE